MRARPGQAGRQLGSGAQAARVPTMKTILTVLALGLSATFAFARENNFAAVNDVVWHSLGTNENDSMPLGNGDLALNVWTEQNGDLVLLIAKSDAWSETGKIVKLGRLRIKLSPNPFIGSSDFSQTLKLENGSIEIQQGDNTIRVWIDANRPAM